MKRKILTITVILLILFLIKFQLYLIPFFIVLVIDYLTTSILIKLLNKYMSKSFFEPARYLYVLILSLISIILFRLFFFDIYFVPTSSMEKTLFPEDYVLVDKISYGIKIPKHLRNIPVIGRLSNLHSNEYDQFIHFKTFKNFKREDIVVFKSVQEDKFMIKRLIGLPGDTLEIRDSRVLINDIVLNERGSYCYSYKKGNGHELKIISNKEFNSLDSNDKRILKKKILKKDKTTHLIFPASKMEDWTRDNYGKLVIPKKGMDIILNKENYSIYKNIIYQYEEASLSFKENQNYTFKKNYFFVLGDNRHNSIDSRNFGFIPESYIQGKMMSSF